MKELFLVGVGGFAGSVLRYAASLAMLRLVISTGFPWNTLLVNVVGSLLIGALIALGTSGTWYLLFVVGLCGGFTTFSTFSLEMVGLLKGGDHAVAATYFVLSVGLSILATAAGFYLGTKIGTLN